MILYDPSNFVEALFLFCEFVSSYYILSHSGLSSIDSVIKVSCGG